MILGKFKEKFLAVKDLIDNILKTLIDNITTIPYTIRCICKIIDILISKKFKFINKYERNAFIGEFFFGKCILPILINSDVNAVVTSTILSVNTRQCLKIIAKVLTKINRGTFFESSIDTDYTIFNHYIIEVIPEVNAFYDRLVDVTLPHVLDDLINERVGSNDIHSYEYFKENEKELANIQSICFSMQDVMLLVQIIKPNLEEFSQFPKGNLFVKTVERICNHESSFSSFLPSNSVTKCIVLFNVQVKKEEDSTGNPTILKFNEIEENDMLLLQRIKFCVRIILRGMNLINSKVYSYLNHVGSTHSFFSALNQILQLEEFIETESNDKIPLNWYSLYLTSNLKSLKDEYMHNDFEKLYDELLSEELKRNELLKKQSNHFITRFGMNTRCAEKSIEKAKRDLLRMEKIEKFFQLEKFITKSHIKVCVRYMPLEDEDSSDLNTLVITTTDACPHKEAVSKRHTKIEGHANTMKGFIKLLGQLNVLQEDIMNGQQKHRIYDSLFAYIQIVRDVLLKHEMINKLKENEREDRIEEILEGIENYLMKKLYTELYPKEGLDEDIEFFMKTRQLSWITPMQLEIKKAYLNENLWKLAIKCVNQMDEEKTPYDKLRCILSAHKIINNCIKFCSGKDEDAGADDMAPIFQYIILKAQPRRMISNINYLKSLIHPSKLMGIMGFLLCHMESAAEFILHELTYTSVKMTKEEFERLIANNSQ